MSESSFRAEPYLEQLLPFQRATVEHVTDILYRNKTGTRFLVADETGLGKTVGRKGVIAIAIEALQVDRIDIIYLCSNADVARQNMQRLDFLGNSHVHWNVPGNPVDFEQRMVKWIDLADMPFDAISRTGTARRSSQPATRGRRLTSFAEQDAPDADIPGLVPEWVCPGLHKVIRDLVPY